MTGAAAGGDDGRRAHGARRGRVVFWSLFVLLVGAGAWLLFWPHAAVDVLPPQETAVERPAPQAGVRSAMLYFGDASGRTLLSERRDLASGPTFEERVEAVFAALARGPEQRDATPSLPPATHLERAFFDDDTGSLYLDFGAALVTRHPGGSAAEYHTLAAIVRTLAANFPEVRRVQVLVDGEPIDSLAGHFDTSRPIDIATWR